MKKILCLILCFSLFLKAHADHHFYRDSSTGLEENITMFGKIGACISAFCYFWTGESETKKQEKRFAKDRRWQDDTFSYYNVDDYIKHCGYDRYNLEWSYAYSVHDDPILRRFYLYRFPVFRDFIFQSPRYKERVLQLKDEIQQGKKFEISGCTHAEFKSLIFDMAAEFLYEYNYNYSLPTPASTSLKAEVKKVSHQEKQLEAKREQILAAMQQEENDLMADYVWYYELEQDEILSAATMQDQFLIKRIDALTSFQEGTVNWKQETYTLSAGVIRLLSEHTIDKQSYEVLYGNQIQHVLHGELLSILHDTALLQQSTETQECTRISTTLTRFVDVGKQHNEAGFIKKACLCADFCWGMLEGAQAVLGFYIEVEKAQAKGVVKGADRFVKKVKDPIRTIREMRHNVRSLGFMLYGLVEDAKYHAYLRLKDALIDTRDEFIGRLDGTFVPPAMKDKGFKELFEVCNHSVEVVSAILDSASSKITRENMLYVADEGAALATEMGLQYVTCQAFSALISHGSAAVKLVIEAGNGPLDFMDLPASVGNFEAAISYEAILAVERAAAVEATGKAAAATIDKMAQIIPLTTLAQNTGAGTTPLCGGNLPNPPIDIIQAMQPLTEADLLEVNKYIGLATHNGNQIIPPFEHTWIAKITKSGKITGFHQDRNGYYRKLGLIKDVEMQAEGFYTAKVYVNGQWIKRSFFPEDWNISNLMGCYYEVAKQENISQCNAIRTTFELERKSGINITVVIENNGTGVTFFPNLIP